MDLTDSIGRKKLYRLKPRKEKVVVARGSDNISGKYSVGAVVASQLIPFRKNMIAQLHSIGYNTANMSWKSIIAAYYNEFVSNKQNKLSPFIPINSYEFCNNLAFKISPKDNITGTFEDFRNTSGMGQIGMVVENIINSYKYAKGKKDRAIRDGEKPELVLSNVELSQAKAVEVVSKRLSDKLEDNTNVKTGQVKKIIMWGLVFFIIYKLLA